MENRLRDMEVLLLNENAIRKLAYIYLSNNYANCDANASAKVNL